MDCQVSLYLIGGTVNATLELSGSFHSSPLALRYWNYLEHLPSMSNVSRSTWVSVRRYSNKLIPEELALEWVIFTKICLTLDQGDQTKFSWEINKVCLISDSPNMSFNDNKCLYTFHKYRRTRFSGKARHAQNLRHHFFTFLNAVGLMLNE